MLTCFVIQFWPLGETCHEIDKWTMTNIYYFYLFVILYSICEKKMATHTCISSFLQNIEDRVKL
jgi:hypothetical protein